MMGPRRDDGRWHRWRAARAAVEFPDRRGGRKDRRGINWSLTVQKIVAGVGIAVLILERLATRYAEKVKTVCRAIGGD